jgi:uncharacterized protein YeaO (DUF488 family)
MMGISIPGCCAAPRADRRTAVRRGTGGGTILVTHLLAPTLVKEAARILVERIWPPYPLQRQIRVTMWMKELSPSLALRDWFDRHPTFRPEFASFYRLELEANPAALDGLRTLLRRCPVTLLYAAGDVEHTHATILADCILQDRGGHCAHTPS